ncbi:L-ascorbate metabolism protein UlaG (beta-lactamase superfamily) [Paenibacillus endophyticus]|uniref:L-ascorbate metabolism protein UlaG (Beta-lactamase superfamily) n=1 Tax=Paenibacillus endophyticus TaxID=1294268 RepID=A0A7W5G9F4_9BACL|nr:MBL fold metallo-hydrolase [Paenibacillus endophyticus]MBB3150912.1 L-ascorbate metabolism protein UlaG (beta-lactamase superfamily) [Paenibacillus endophyticus]
MRLKRFANIDPIEQHTSLKQFKRWRQERIRRLRMKDYSFTVPNVEPDIAYLEDNRKWPSLTWVGHSTFFIQLGGLNIMTDPVWSTQMAFQKRLSPPGIPIDDVPPVDVVLISHSHYDHLNINSLRRLIGGRQLLVPAGLGAKLRKKGFIRVHELHWWESVMISGVKFTFVPSQHSTRRSPWDTNSSHWGGFVIERPASRSGKLASRPAGSDASIVKVSSANAEARAETASAAQEADRLHPFFSGVAEQERPQVADFPTIYFAGDSGYFQGFKEIGKRFPIDVALLPIGAYEPEWFMAPQHITPEQALQAFDDLSAKWFVPMHFGAFKLADDTPREALDRLEAERRSRSIPDERIVILPLGETWRLSGK